MGVWIETFSISSFCILVRVTPRVGVWIETSTLKRIRRNAMSLPAWECGLKPPCMAKSDEQNFVTPRVGVWIETRSQ